MRQVLTRTFPTPQIRSRHATSAPPPVASLRPEPLESRLLFHLEPAAAIPNTVGNPGGADTVVDLTGRFDDETINGTIIRLATTSGNIDLEMFDSQTPRTVRNYLDYVTSGRYNGTIIHRSIPTFVIQGGGFTPNGQHIQQLPPVRNEADPSRSNVRGTIAMAKIPGFQDFNGNGQQDPGEPSIPGGGPDSATSEWFINLGDNGGSPPNGLDFQNGGFTVFGRVINNTLTGTVDAIAALPIEDASAIAGALTDLPVRADVPAGQTPDADDMVIVNTAGVIPEAGLFTYTATSSDPALVNPVVEGSNVRLQYGTGTGTATITVTAMAADGTTAQQTFQAGVGELTLTISGQRGQPKSIVFTDADATRGRVSIARAGQATIRLLGTDLTQTTNRLGFTVGGTVTRLASIAATDTTQETTLSVKGRGGDNLVEGGGLTTDAGLRALAARGLNVIGNATVGGTARTVQLGRLADGTLSVGGVPADGVPVSIDVATAQNATVTSGSNVRSFRTGAFGNTGTRTTITAPEILAITARDAFDGNLNVAGRVNAARFADNFSGALTAASIGAMSVRGDMTGANVDTNAAFDPDPRSRTLGSLKVNGAINNTRVLSSGNVGSITGGSATDSTFFAAIQGSPNQLPDDASRFNSLASIRSARFGSFADSLLSAATLGRINVGTVTTSNAGEAFGVASNVITLLAGRTDAGQRFTLRNLDAQADADQQIAAAGVNLADFQVRVF